MHMEEVFEMRSDQEETDTRVILYIKWAQDKGYASACVRSPDSDIFFPLLKYASSFTITILFDTGVKEKRRILPLPDIAKDLGEYFCDSLLGLHVFTGEDANCAFKGKGKLMPLNKLQKKPRYQCVLRRFGSSFTVSPSLIDDLEQFT